MSQEWDEIGFIISSRYRVESMKRLNKGPATPSQIADDAGVGIAHISRALQDLKDKDAVDLLVSEDRKKGRVYGLTEKGKNTWEKIDSENLATRGAET